MSIDSPAPAPRLCPVSAIRSHPMDWLWPGRLALGKLAVLEGDPGLSKSFLALDLCARLSTGRPWPDDAPAAETASCIVLNGEDDVADTIAPRLSGLSADPARVFVLDRQDAEGAAALALPDDLATLEQLVRQVQARLLVIDPVMAFFSAAVCVSNFASIRRALAPLALMAQRQNCAVLLIRHLAKAEGARAIHRGLGSVGLGGTCRSIWLVAEDPAQPTRRVLAQVKNNVAAPQPSLAFEVKQPDGGAPALHWLGPVAISADALLSGTRRRGPPPALRDAACDFLHRILADGPLPAREVWRRAAAEGISFGTLRRAKNEIPVKQEYQTVNRIAISYWKLPQDDLPADTPPTAEPDPILERLRQLEEQYPSRSPLDDL